MNTLNRSKITQNNTFHLHGNALNGVLDLEIIVKRIVIIGLYTMYIVQQDDRVCD